MRVVDLFCGCGGLSLGFEKAGMDIVAAFDNWVDALTVYRNNFNHPAIKLDLSDINLSAAIIRRYNPDMIIGGPPCQDFSSAGKRNEDNGRGDLTVCYAKIISTIRPQWFVMENVERILKTQKLQDALALFRSAGYGLTYTVMNAALCGVPQRRKRFVMIGKLDENDDFIHETLLEKLSDHEMSVAEYCGDKLPLKYYYRHPRSYVRRGIFSTSEPSATIRGVNRPMPQGYKLHPGDPVDSLEGIRPLTSRERSMIQTFPEDFNFDGTKTNIEQMIGNAVPVNLAFFVADAIFRYSGEKRANKDCKASFQKYNLFSIFDQYANNPIADYSMANADVGGYCVAIRPGVEIEPDRKSLIGRNDNDMFQFVENIGTGKARFNCKKWPKSIYYKSLKYFMPYIEGRGIRDIYLIDDVHINEQGNNKTQTYSLVFELRIIGMVFDDYEMVDLEFWNKLSETTSNNIIDMWRRQKLQ